MRILFASALAIIMAGPAVAEGNMSVVNCTETDVRIFFYNNRDAVMLIAKSNIDIDRQTTGQFSVAGSGPSKARVFRRQLLDEPVLIRADLDHDGKYYLSATGGEWRLNADVDTCINNPER